MRRIALLGITAAVVAALAFQFRPGSPAPGTDATDRTDQTAATVATMPPDGPPRVRAAGPPTRAPAKARATPPKQPAVRTTGSDFGTYQGNAAHTGVVSPLARSPKKRWTRSFPRLNDLSSPVIGGGRVFAAGGTSAPRTVVLFALDARTGKTRWQRSVPENPTVSVAYDAGRVFLVRDATIRAFDAATGRPLWVYTDPGRAASIHDITPAGGYLYFAAAGPDRATALRASTGKVVWRTPMTRVLDHPPSVVGDSVYFAYDCRSVWRLRKATGTVVWHQKPSGCSSGSTAMPVVHGSQLWVNLPTGAADGNNTDNRGAVLSLATGRTLRSFSSSTPVFSGRTAVVIKPYEARLTGLDASSGKVLWRTAPVDPLHYVTAPLVSGRTVYIGAQDEVEAYDLGTGRRVWHGDPGNQILGGFYGSGIAIGSGVLAVLATTQITAFG